MRTEEILHRMKNLVTGKKTEEQVFSLSGGNVPPVEEKELPDWSEPPTNAEWVEPQNREVRAPINDISGSKVISHISGSASFLYIPPTEDFDPDDPMKEHYGVAPSTFVDVGEVQYPSVLSENWVQKAIDFGEEEMVDHPDHYNRHPAGVEVIDIIEELSFNVGNAIKYLMRAEYKGEQVQDLEKAAWYINREIERLRKRENA